MLLESRVQYGVETKPKRFISSFVLLLGVGHVGFLCLQETLTQAYLEK